MPVAVGSRGIARLAAVAALALLCAAGCHRFDQSQVPVITVGKGLRPQISWTPSPAYVLKVYAGDKDGDGFGVLWSAVGTADYANRLTSPVTYGVPPPNSDIADAPPLEAGRTYTVTVERKDEKGGGDGFMNTRRRYLGVQTFIANES